ncbi:MAG: S1 family peptidase [Alkalilacustris sp.]
MSIPDQLARTTVRLECSRDGAISCGTSFYHQLVLLDGRKVPVLITNRHVIEGFDEVTMSFSTAVDLHTATEGDRRAIRYRELQSVAMYHPDPEIDLALICLGPILNSELNDGSIIRLTEVQERDFLSPEMGRRLSFAENILVVGYPQGLWDRGKNLPLFRRGITATPCMIDYEGQPKFLIDCSIFPGSSGSPVFFYNYPSFVENDQIQFGERWGFIGIVSAVMLYNAEGEVIEEQVPTSMRRASARMPNNLGIVIRASAVSEFLERARAFLSERLAAQP